MVTDEQVTELESLTLGQERDNVKQWHWNSSVELTITSLSGETERPGETHLDRSRIVDFGEVLA